MEKSGIDQVKDQMPGFNPSRMCWKCLTQGMVDSGSDALAAELLKSHGKPVTFITAADARPMGRE